MKKVTLILVLVFVIFLSIGFMLGFKMDEHYAGDEKFCSPANKTGSSESQPCNRVSSFNPLFHTIILNVNERCEGYDVFIFEDGDNIGSRMVKDECSTDVVLFSK